MILKKKFDIVLASEVLLHVPPQEIQFVINQLLEITKYHFIHIDFNSEYKPKFILPHNFAHKYIEIYKKKTKMWIM